MAPQPHPGEVGRLLGWMAHVVRDPDLTEWERTFTASILARARSPRFQPSEKQIAVMRRLVAAFQAATFRVIED